MQNPDAEGCGAVDFMHPDFSVLEPLDSFGTVEDSLESHPGVLLGDRFRKQDLSCQEPPQDALRDNPRVIEPRRSGENSPTDFAGEP